MELVPAPASAYVCPMHPDVMSASAGKCPRCNMDLVPGSPLSMPDFTLEVETVPRVLKAGQPIKFRFVVRHPLTGEQAKQFATIHDKLFHLFVISRDLEEFAHIHPEAQPDGSFTITHVLPKPGHYVLFSDFLALGGGAQIVATPIATAGVDTDLMAAQARLTPDPPWTRTADGAKVELLNQQSEFLGGEEIDLVFRFRNAETDVPITDLQRYLGAWGHLLAASSDLVDMIHTHPAWEEGGPNVQFNLIFPRPGVHRVWVQFQRQGVVNTAHFDVPVTAL